ncbi:MAG: Gfo/Idh/MocA family protein [Nitrospinota bacterium]
MPAGAHPPVGICIMGCGQIARTHARVIARRGGEVRLFFASRSAEKAEDYRGRFRGEAAFGSYEEALADPRVGAAVICTPHDLHVEHARLAAAHGVHVLMEKPIGRTLEEADEIIRAVREAKPKAGGRCVLMVAENFRFKPSVRKARRLIQSGVVGRVKCVRVKVAALARHEGWRTEASRMGGGALVDGGIHWVDTLLYWAGPPKRVYAVQGPKTRDNVPVEDTVHVLAEHEGGVVSELTHSWGIPSPGRVQFSSISGTEGTLYVENHGYFLCLTGARRRFFFSPLRDWAGFGMHAEFLRAVRRRVSDSPPPPPSPSPLPHDGPDADDSEPEMSGAEGRRSLAFVLAAYRSIREGRAVVP